MVAGITESERRAEVVTLEARIAEISAFCDVLDRERLACIRRMDELGGWADQGAKTCAHWLSWRIGCELGTAREHVRVARALAKLPPIDAALGKAQLSYAKVRALTRVATAENEKQLLELARHATAPQIEVLCRNIDQSSIRTRRPRSGS